MSGIGSQSPNWREALTAKDSITGNAEYVTSTNNKLDVNASVSISGSPLPVTGVSSAIATAIVDGSGNQITSFGGGTQYTDGGTPPAHPVGPTLIYDNTGTWQHVSAANPLPTTITGVATSANQTNGNQQTKLTNGTNIADVVAGDTGFNGVATASATKTYTFTNSGNGAQVLLANTPTSGYAYVTVIAPSVGSGLAWGGQFAPNSGGTYVTTSQWINRNATGQGGAALGTSVNTFYISPVTGPYFQLNVTALASGTLSGYVILSNSPQFIGGVSVNQGGNWTVGSNSATGSAVPANAHYIGMSNAGNLSGLKAIFTNNDGSSGADSLDVGTRIYNGTTFDRVRSGGVTGMAGVSLQASPSGGYSFLHIAAGQATTTVKAGSGTLHAIIFNGAATATNVTTIYDNTAGSGTVIGIPTATAVTTPESVIYDLAFATGLTIVTATANGSDMTVVYK